MDGIFSTMGVVNGVLLDCGVIMFILAIQDCALLAAGWETF